MFICLVYLFSWYYMCDAAHIFIDFSLPSFYNHLIFQILDEVQFSKQLVQHRGKPKIKINAHWKSISDKLFSLSLMNFKSDWNHRLPYFQNTKLPKEKQTKIIIQRVCNLMELCLNTVSYNEKKIQNEILSCIRKILFFFKKKLGKVCNGE